MGAKGIRNQEMPPGFLGGYHDGHDCDRACETLDINEGAKGYKHSKHRW